MAQSQTLVKASDLTFTKELTAYKGSKEWLKGQFPDGTFPTVKELQIKKEALENRKKRSRAIMNIIGIMKKISKLSPLM